MRIVMFFSFLGILLIVNSCEKEAMEIYNQPKIMFSAQEPENNLKSSKASKALSESFNTKSEIANGEHYNIYGEGTVGMWWTENEELVNWQLTGPNGLDSTVLNVAMFTYTFQDLGDYNMRAYRNPPYGFEWFMSATLNSGIDEALVVMPEFMGSEWISPSDVFRYYWRVPKPVILNGSETLFRVQGLSGVIYNPFPVFYNQVQFSADGNYIEWYYDYPASGLQSFGAKTNVGFINISSEEIWLTIDPDSPWRCQDSSDNNIIDGVHYNGQVRYLGTIFSPPAGTQTASGDYNNTVPVVLMGYPVGGQVPLFLLCDPTTTHWRHKLESEEEWTTVAISIETNGRIYPVLPSQATYQQRVVQYGRQTAEGWENDSYMVLSSMYIPVIQGFRFAYGGN